MQIIFQVCSIFLFVFFEFVYLIVCLSVCLSVFCLFSCLFFCLSDIIVIVCVEWQVCAGVGYLYTLPMFVAYFLIWPLWNTTFLTLSQIFCSCLSPRYLRIPTQTFLIYPTITYFIISVLRVEFVHT
jgi:hypothetical protein